MEEISFRGHPVSYIAPSSYGHSHVRSSFFYAQLNLHDKPFLCVNFLVFLCLIGIVDTFNELRG